MSRSLHASLVTALANDDSFTVVWLMEANFNSGVIRWVTGPYDIVYDSDTYSAAGELLQFTELGETSGLEAKGIQITLSGAPASLLSTALGEVRLNKEVKIWMAFLDTDAALIGDPVLRFQGYTDSITVIDEPQSPKITLNVENKLIRLTKPNIRRYTDQDQKDLFSGDKGLEYVAALQDQIIAWGSGVEDKYKKDS